MIFKYWYWYFLFQKRTEILILQYYFCCQYQYFSISFNDLVTMFEATKIVLMNVYWSCVVKYANIGFIFYNKTHLITYILSLMSIQYKVKFTLIFQIRSFCFFSHFFSRKNTDTEYWYFSFFSILILILIQYFSDWILILILQYLKIILDTEY